MLDPVPASRFCHYFNPLMHLKRVNLLHHFFMLFGRRKVLQVFFFLAYNLAVLEKIFTIVCPKQILHILDNAHSNKQGLLSVQFRVLEIICKHNCGLRTSKYYCAEAFIKYGIARYSLTTSKELVLLRSISFSASRVQSPPTGLGFFVGCLFFPTQGMKINMF